MESVMLGIEVLKTVGAVVVLVSVGVMLSDLVCAVAKRWVE